jgi:chemotaxis protein CheC
MIGKAQEQTQENELSAYTHTPTKVVDLSILLELGSIGAGHAATSLSDVLQKQVQIDVPKIHTLPPHMLPNYYNRHEQSTTAIYLQLASEMDCDILLMFESAEARKIAALMTMTENPDDVDQAMATSAIQELANILIGSFLTAISDFIGTTLVPTPPQWIEDSFDAIIDFCLIKQAALSREALIFDTSFRSSDGAANSMLMLFPSPQMQELLVQKGRELTGAETPSEVATIVYPTELPVEEKA